MAMDLVPIKCFINDINSTNPTGVWIQGTIEQTVGTDILIVSDGSGKAKITKCETADGIVNKSSLKKGTYCCIIGTATKTKGIPVVQANKFIDLSNQTQLLKHSWEYEVKEVNAYLQGKVFPVI